MDILRFLFSAPTSDWLFFACFLIGITGFISIAEKTRSRLDWSPEINRKLVHILTGILICMTPFLFETNKPLIWMAIIFSIVNYMGIRTGKLQGMHGTTRRSYGTVYYPVTFLILVVTCWSGHQAVLILSILILAISDAAAAIVGENLKHPHEFCLARDKKSLEGSVTMFLVTFIIVIILLPAVDYLDELTVSFSNAVWIGLITALVATALEALSTGGSDNLSAPLGSAFVIHVMLANESSANIQLTIGLALALIVALFSYRARFLSASGSVATFLLATLIFGIGGWTWVVPILTFFIFSSLLSKIGKTHKAQFRLMFEKTSRRDLYQVLANGGVAGVAMLLHYFFKQSGINWYVIYLGALAAVNSDTWGTEIGVFSKTKPRLIRNLQKVPTGTSGGITPLGTAGAAAGAFIIALSGWLIAPDQISIIKFPFWIITGAGFLSSLVDSLLGATLQAQYKCPVCNKITEKPVHCQGKDTRFISGHRWLNNDWVNTICSLTGFVLTWLGTQMFFIQ